MIGISSDTYQDPLSAPSLVMSRQFGSHRRGLPHAMQGTSRLCDSLRVRKAMREGSNP
jgi:hypothetical protein